MTVPSPGSSPDPDSPAPSGRRRGSVLWTILGAIIGGVTGLLIGLVWKALADPATFGDLAAAAVTIVALIPAGLIVGGLAGFFLARRRRGGRDSVGG